MRILIVDDNHTSLLVLTKLSARLAGCEPVGFASPQEALAVMPALDFDIAIVDFQMPVYNGAEFVAEMMRFEKYRDKLVVIVTADTDVSTRMTALNAGAIDFITKPIDPLEFKARLRNLVALADARAKLADHTAWLRREVDKAVIELREREEEIIHRLTVAASYKDSETARHTVRVGAYSAAIAHAYGLSETECADIKLAAPMHDVGKVAIPDAVLLKKGKLTQNEFVEMQHHTVAGSDILKESKCSLLQLAAEIACSHHERWDGEGYPSKKAGEKIPLSGRIVAIADNFDALTTARSYKEAWPIEKAIDHIRAGAGTHFDPACVAAFEKALPSILHIKLEIEHGSPKGECKASVDAAVEAA